jgi:hypothetical protein
MEFLPLSGLAKFSSLAHRRPSLQHRHAPRCCPHVAAKEDHVRAPQRPEPHGNGLWEEGGASSQPRAVDMKLEVAKDETIARASEGRKIAAMMKPQVMLSSLISTSIGSSKVASSSKCVAKRSRKKKTHVLLLLGEEEVVGLCPLMQQEQMVDPSNVGCLQKKMPAAMKEKLASSVLAVKVVQEKTSMLVAQGTQEMEAAAAVVEQRL